MSLTDKIVRVIFRADDQATKPVARLEQRLRQMSSSVAALGKAFVATFVAGAIGQFFRSAIAEATEAQNTLNTLRGAVENTGASFTKAAPQLDALVQSMVKMSGRDMDDVSNALANLITKTDDVAGSQRNLQLVMDLAAKEQMSVGEASDKVAKIMNGNTKAARELGITTKDAGTAIQILRERYGGFAEKEGQTFTGTLGRIRNGWKDVLQSVGETILGNTALTGSLNGVVGWLTRLAGWVQENRKGINEFMDGTGRLAGWVSAVVSPVIRMLADLFGSIFVHSVKGAQVVIVALAAEFEIMGERGRDALGALLQHFARFVEEAGALLTLLGINVSTGFADKVGAAGTRLRLEAARSRRIVENARDETIASIGGDGYVRPGRSKATDGGGRRRTVRNDAPGAGTKDRYTEADARAKIARQESLIRIREINPVVDVQQQATVQAMETEAAAVDQLRQSYERYGESLRLINDADLLSGIVEGSRTFADSIALIGSDAEVARGAVAALMRSGSAKGIIKDLAATAKVKVAENVARSLEELARGTATASNPVTAPLAAGHFAAAKLHAVSALKWAVLGAGAGAISGGSGGGGAGGAGAARASARDTERGASSRGTTTVIFPAGRKVILDPTNPDDVDGFARFVESLAGQRVQIRYGGS